MTNDIESKPERGGASRRDALKCMAWAGAGILWTVSGGVPRSLGLIGDAKAADVPTGGLTFVQISDTHLGFKGEANPDVPGTVRRAVEMINPLPTRPAFVVHTGDITHLSKPQEFDDAAQLLKELKIDRVHYIPCEHDMLDDGPAGYLKRYGAGKQGNGWFSFEHGGVHVVGPINVVDFKLKGLGVLGDEQLEWLEKDVANLPASTPVIVLAHMPLWSVRRQGLRNHGAPRRDNRQRLDRRRRQPPSVIKSATLGSDGGSMRQIEQCFRYQRKHLREVRS